MDTVPRVSSFTITRATIERASLEMKVIIFREHFFLFSRLRLQTFTKTPSAPHVILRESHTKKW
jgi:hypothetical protein